MCQHCETLKAKTAAAFEYAQSNDEIAAYFDARSLMDEENKGWMEPVHMVPDMALEVFERVVTATFDFMDAKGRTEQYIEEYAVPVPVNVSLSIIRELQMRRAIDQVMEEEDFKHFL